MMAVMAVMAMVCCARCEFSSFLLLLLLATHIAHTPVAHTIARLAKIKFSKFKFIVLNLVYRTENALRFSRSLSLCRDNNFFFLKSSKTNRAYAEWNRWTHTHTQLRESFIFYFYLVNDLFRFHSTFFDSIGRVSKLSYALIESK